MCVATCLYKFNFVSYSYQNRQSPSKQTNNQSIKQSGQQTTASNPITCLANDKHCITSAIQQWKSNYANTWLIRSAVGGFATQSTNQALIISPIECRQSVRPSVCCRLLTALCRRRIIQWLGRQNKLISRTKTRPKRCFHKVAISLLCGSLTRAASGTFCLQFDGWLVLGDITCLFSEDLAVVMCQVDTGVPVLLMLASVRQPR